MNTLVKRKDLVYPELSYKIVGGLIDVYKQLGGVLQEKHYQRAVAAELKKLGLRFQEQAKLPLKYKNELIGNFFADFLIDNKIILEIKKDSMYGKRNFDQVNAYLKASNLKLAILANFTKAGLRFKRVVNLS